MYKSTKLQTSHVQEYKTANLSCTRVQTTSYKLLNYESTKLQISYFKKLQSSKPLMYKSTKLSNNQKKFYKLLNNQIKIIQNYQTTHNPYFTKLSNKQTHISQNYQTNQPIFYKTIKQTNPSIYKFGLSVCLFVTNKRQNG